MTKSSSWLPLLLLMVADAWAQDAPPRAEQIAAMEKIADLALIPPTLNTSPLPEYDYDRLDYGMTIGIERTPRGRLWACWVAGGDSPKAFFVLATSDDDGETWSKPRLVVDAHAKDLPAERSVLVGNLWTDPLGRLWLIFDQSMDMFDGRAGVWMAVCENPDAEEPQWSPPRRIWHGVTLNKPTVLSTGEWMLPISLDQRDGFRQFKGCFRELDPLRGANVFVSKDQGATWERRGSRAISQSRLARAHGRRAEGRLALDAGPHHQGTHAKHVARTAAGPGPSRQSPPSNILRPGFTSGVWPPDACCWSNTARPSTRTRAAANSPPGSRTTTARPGTAD